MVTLRCDACGFVCDHTVCGVLFAVAWIASGRTKLAHCRDYGAKTNCPGVLGAPSRTTKSIRKCGRSDATEMELD